MTTPSNPKVPPNAIKAHDVALLQCLRDSKFMSLDQLHRLFWAGAEKSTAARRLSTLSSYGLLQQINTATKTKAASKGLKAAKTEPVKVMIDPEEMSKRGLVPSPIFLLAPGGRQWLTQMGLPTGYPAKAEQMLHDLVLAEVQVALSEAVRRRGAGWRLEWFGEEAISAFLWADEKVPVLVPDALAVIYLPGSEGEGAWAFFIELDASRETHRRRSSQIGHKLIEYRNFTQRWRRHPTIGRLRYFPPVLFITHGQRRRQNLLMSILTNYQPPVRYGLALWQDLLSGQDFLAASAWTLISSQGRLVPGLEPEQLHPLLGCQTWLDPEFIQPAAALFQHRSDEPETLPGPTPASIPSLRDPVGSREGSYPQRGAASEPAGPELRQPGFQSDADKTATPVTLNHPPLSRPEVQGSLLQNFRAWYNRRVEPIYLLMAVMVILMLIQKPLPINFWPEVTPPTATIDPFAYVPTVTPWGQHGPTSSAAPLNLPPQSLVLLPTCGNGRN